MDENYPNKCKFLKIDTRRLRISIKNSFYSEINEFSSASADKIEILPQTL